MELKLLVFDLDGTLLDTLEDLADSCNYALNQADLPSLAVEEYKLHVGSGARNLVGSAIASAMSLKLNRKIKEEEVDPQLTDKLYGIYNQAYAAGWANKTSPYTGASELLSDLHEAGYKLAVLSNKPDDFTREMTTHYFDPEKFDLIFGKRDEWPLKPDPQLALHICQQLSIDPQQTVMIGDSGSDMETAVRAGFQAYGVLWGFRGQDELLSFGADKLFTDVTELRNYLLQN